MKIYGAVMAFALLTVSACAAPPNSRQKPPPVRHFRKVLQDVWREGGVCRHAAVIVCAEAALNGMPCTMPAWEINEEGDAHVIPVILHPGSGKWHSIDQWHMRAQSVTLNSPPKSCAEAEDVSPYDCTKFLGNVEEEDIETVVQWIQEAIFLGLMDPKDYLEEDDE